MTWKPHIVKLCRQLPFHWIQRSQAQRALLFTCFIQKEWFLQGFDVLLPIVDGVSWRYLCRRARGASSTMRCVHQYLSCSPHFVVVCLPNTRKLFNCWAGFHIQDMLLHTNERTRKCWIFLALVSFDWQTDITNAIGLWSLCIMPHDLKLFCQQSCLFDANSIPTTRLLLAASRAPHPPGLSIC